MRLMYVGDNRHIEGALDLLEDPEPLFHPRTTEGVHRGAVGLVEAGLEHVGNAQLASDLDIGLTDLHGQIP